MALSGESWVLSDKRRKSDIALAIALTPAVSPFLASGIALSRFADGPHPLFRQQRVGKQGELFNIFKIRTMPGVTEDNPSFGAQDLRASKVGSFLRHTAIDELPQLYNVLNGDLSIIGPRALIPSEIEDMKQVLPRTLFDQWEDVYKTGGPGCISTYGHASHAAERNLEKSYLQRAELDVADFNHASPRHDMQLLLRLGNTASRVATDGS